MIQGLAGKMLIKVVMKQVVKAVQKMDDKKLASDHEKRIEKLEKNSHPPQEYVCCKDCGCEIDKIK
tara:strand:- start:300 stop:497 length:198 start_codon:yes stop_codon:yes gene_type:complete